MSRLSFLVPEESPGVHNYSLLLLIIQPVLTFSTLSPACDQGWIAAFSLVTQEGSTSAGQMGEISIFTSVDTNRKIPAVLVLGNLH